jgi:hypothetical protein
VITDHNGRLPATYVKIFEAAGNLPSEIVMSAEDTVAAALVGLDQGELVTSQPNDQG